MQAGKFDLSKAVLDIKGLELATETFNKLSASFTKDPKNNYQIVFPSGGLKDLEGLMAKVKAMGVPVSLLGTAGQPELSISTFPHGIGKAKNASQPTVEIKWDSSPDSKTTIQIHSRVQQVCLKGKRCALMPRMDDFLVFFGAPVKVDAKVAVKGPPPVWPLTIKEALESAAAQALYECPGRSSESHGEPMYISRLCCSYVFAPATQTGLQT